MIFSFDEKKRLNFLLELHGVGKKNQRKKIVMNKSCLTYRLNVPLFLSLSFIQFHMLYACDDVMYDM